MLLTSPPTLQFKSFTLSNPFLHGAIATAHLFKPTTTSFSAPPRSAAPLPVIKAMRSLQGKVVCSASDKTVAVEVVRLAPHPKYKRRVRKKKTYQAHDPMNQFNVGDLVQLDKARPISKNKTFWAVPVPPRSRAKPKELGIPFESPT